MFLTLVVFYAYFIEIGQCSQERNALTIKIIKFEGKEYGIMISIQSIRNIMNTLIIILTRLTLRSIMLVEPWF